MVKEDFTKELLLPDDTTIRDFLNRKKTLRRIKQFNSSPLFLIEIEVSLEPRTDVKNKFYVVDLEKNQVLDIFSQIKVTDNYYEKIRSHIVLGFLQNGDVIRFFQEEKITPNSDQNQSKSTKGDKFSKTNVCFFEILNRDSDYKTKSQKKFLCNLCKDSNLNDSTLKIVNRDLFSFSFASPKKRRLEKVLVDLQTNRVTPKSTNLNFFSFVENKTPNFEYSEPTSNSDNCSNLCSFNVLKETCKFFKFPNIKCFNKLKFLFNGSFVFACYQNKFSKFADLEGENESYCSEPISTESEDDSREKKEHNFELQVQNLHSSKVTQNLEIDTDTRISRSEVDYFVKDLSLFLAIDFANVVKVDQSKGKWIVSNIFYIDLFLHSRPSSFSNQICVLDSEKCLIFDTCLSKVVQKVKEKDRISNENITTLNNTSILNNFDFLFSIQSFKYSYPEKSYLNRNLKFSFNEEENCLFLNLRIYITTFRRKRKCRRKVNKRKNFKNLKNLKPVSRDFEIQLQFDQKQYSIVFNETSLAGINPEIQNSPNDYIYLVIRLDLTNKTVHFASFIHPIQIFAFKVVSENEKCVLRIGNGTDSERPSLKEHLNCTNIETLDSDKTYFPELYLDFQKLPERMVVQRGNIQNSKSNHFFDSIKLIHFTSIECEFSAFL